MQVGRCSAMFSDIQRCSAQAMQRRQRKGHTAADRTAISLPKQSILLSLRARVLYKKLDFSDSQMH